MPRLSVLAQIFRDKYGTDPRIFHAPGRVNIIGEHTDYNDGFVMPAAIQLRTRVGIASAAERQITIKSQSYDDTVQFHLDGSHSLPKDHWSNYVSGVALVLENAGHRLRGANLLIASDVPLGGGLSSSAALEVASALALLANSGIEMEPSEIARVCQRAENEFVGARSGIMDQMAAVNGRRDRALLLDCRSLEIQYLHIPRHVAMVACNTMVRHALASGEYNRRREQCEQGVAILRRFLPAIRALRDVSSAQFAEFAPKLPEIIRKRCLHVIEEDERVLAAADCLRREDLAELGRLMIASHNSLRHHYEVSSAELDTMVELALGMQGVYGARMMGGGFGGSAIALVESAQAEDFSRRIADAYKERTGIQPEITVCSASDGAGEDVVEG